MNFGGEVFLKAGKIVLIVLAASAMASCKTIKPYEKEYLLSPLMDDGAIARTDNKFGREACGSFEKLAGLGGGGGSSACPTCGI